MTERLYNKIKNKKLSRLYAIDLKTAIRKEKIYNTYHSFKNIVDLSKSFESIYNQWLSKELISFLCYYFYKVKTNKMKSNRLSSWEGFSEFLKELGPQHIDNLREHGLKIKSTVSVYSWKYLRKKQYVR